MLFAGIVTGCVEVVTGAVKGAVEGAKVVGEVGSGIGGALSDYASAAKDELPLLNLKRISKGVYTVDVDAWSYRYSETQRKNAINLLVQLIGYESYDFKMAGEPSFQKKTFNPVWSYSITMPGSIPVVRNEKYSSFKIADIACTSVPDTTFGKSKIKAIAYGDGVFVAVSEDKKMAYSQDGISWTAVNNKTINFLLEDITYGNGKFVAVGYYGGSKMAYSSDGANWTEVKDTSFKKDSIGSIVYGNGLFVAAAQYDNGKLAYSPDGVNWTQVKTFPFKRKYIDVAYGEGKFFVFDRYGNGELAYSQDGITWITIADSTFGTVDIYDIVYGDGKFIAVGSYGKMAYWDGNIE